MTIRPGHSGERKRVPRRAQRNSFQLSLERLEERVLLSLDTQDDWNGSEDRDLSADQDSVWVTDPTSLSESAATDSFMNGQLGVPQYTRSEMLGQSGVPDVLLSGHHQAIEAWRKQQATEQTHIRRPDLMAGTSESE